MLVVEDHALVAQALAHVLRRYGETETAQSAHEARLRLPALAHRLIALVVDVGLPDGSGLDIAELGRTLVPDLSILIITADASIETNHRAYVLDAQILLKPFAPTAMELAAQRAFARRNQRARDLIGRLECFAGRHSLTAREQELVALAMRGLSRNSMADELGVSENTLKTMARRLLRKCAAPSLAELANDAWKPQL